MFGRQNRASASRCRGIALTIAILLLFAQSLSTAHVHQKELGARLAHSVQIADTFCALCLLHCHSPINPSMAPVTATPATVIRHLASLDRVRLLAFPLSQLSCRAPPISL